MPTTEERVAVLENIAQRNGADIDALFKEIRHHAEKEEANQKAVLEMIADIKETQSKQKSFIGGAIWAVAGILAAVQAAWKYFGS